MDLAARVVVPLSGTAASGHLGEILNDAVCGAANGHGLTILHGIRDQAKTSSALSALGWFWPNEVNLIRERKLTAATMPMEQAHARRLLAELAGTRLPSHASVNACRRLSGVPSR